MQEKLDKISKDYQILHENNVQIQEKLISKENERNDINEINESLEYKFIEEKDNLQFETKILKKIVDDLEKTLQITQEEKKFYQQKLYFFLESKCNYTQEESLTLFQ